MVEKSRTENRGTDRRTFLKTFGITAGIASYGSTMSVAEDGNGGGRRADEWTDARSGRGRTGTTDERGPMPYATFDWVMDLGGSMYRTEPVVADELLYLAVTTDNAPGNRDGFVGAYGVETGDLHWMRCDIPAPKTPTVDDGMLVLSTQIAEEEAPNESGLYALDADTGGTKWTHPTPDVGPSPVVADGRVFTSDRTGTSALDRETGERVWHVERGGAATMGVGDVLTHGKTLIYDSGTLYTSAGTALDAKDGSMVWRVGNGKRTLGSPAFRDGMVYYTKDERIVGDDKLVRVQAREADTGAREWTHRERKNEWNGRPAVTDEAVFVVDFGAGESSLRALHAKTGTTKWTTNVPGTFLSNPMATDEMVYVGGLYVPESGESDGRALVHALDRTTGTRRWSYLLDESAVETSPETPPAAGTPVVSDGNLYTATYPAGSTLDYEYTSYSNLFVLRSCR